jgi:hypothetical protein
LAKRIKEKKSRRRAAAILGSEKLSHRAIREKEKYNMCLYALKSSFFSVILVRNRMLSPYNLVALFSLIS